MRHYILTACTFVILQIILLSVFGQDTSYSTDKLYPETLLKADLHFLQAQLDSIHPGLYHYTTKESIKKIFDSLDHSIVRPMREQEFLSLIMLLNEKICDGHTMFLPSEAAMTYNKTGGKFFPFSIAFIKEKLYIIENNSTDSTIQPGAQILEINGQPVSLILKLLMKRQIRDGYNQTYPLWILNHYFAAYYSYTFGQPASFHLKLINKKGEIAMKQVHALKKDIIRRITESKGANLKAQPQSISLEEQETTKTALLTIKSFDSDRLKEVYQQDFLSVIDSVFKKLRKHEITNLLLDLRDNQGGDFETGRHLLSYLIKSSSAYLIGSSQSRLLQPKEDNFTGNLFVLINGGSFSNTAIVSACLERDGRAVFIGEETGGNKSVAYGESTDIVLPHTRIQAYISTSTFPVSYNPSNHGVIPCYIVQPTLTELLTGKDPAKTFALRLIKTQKNK